MRVRYLVLIVTVLAALVSARATCAQDAATHVLLQSVSIYDSPAMPDSGGHSILGGLLTGNLTAILPDLRICAGPHGSAPNGMVCTAVCKPGHQCLDQPFPGGVSRDPRYPDMTVQVWDCTPRPAAPPCNMILATFTKDIMLCNSNTHCKEPVTDTKTFGQGAEIEISFQFRSCSTDFRGAPPQFRSTPVTLENNGVVRANSGAVEVRAPIMIDGISKATGRSVADPGYVAVTVKNPNAKFVQFFYREAIEGGVGGTDIAGFVQCPRPQVQSGQGCADGKSPNVLSECVNTTDPGDTHLCEPLSANPQAPDWILDKNMTVPVPTAYYTLVDTINNTCQENVTLFDHPTFPPNSHFALTDFAANWLPSALVTEDPTWRFTANDFIIINGPLAYKVVWVLVKEPTSDEQYTTVSAQPTSTGAQKQLDELLAKYKLTL